MSRIACPAAKRTGGKIHTQGSAKMVEYYILSTKCSIQERKTKKNGIVYDVVFRVITTDGREVQKRLSGYRTKKAAREAHVRFVTEKCTVAESNPAKAIMAVMPEGYRVENKPPPRGKDVNDFLCHRLGIPIRGSHSKEPER